MISSFMIYSPHRSLFRRPNRKQRDGWDMGHVGGEERCIEGFDVGNLRERDYLEDLVVDGRIKLIYKE